MNALIYSRKKNDEDHEHDKQEDKDPEQQK